MAHSIDEATDEPKLTLDRLVADYGAGATVRALARALRSQRQTRRLEGERSAARALRRAELALIDQSTALEEEGA